MRSDKKIHIGHFLLQNAAAFMPLVMVPFGLLVRQEFVDSRFYTTDAIFILLTGAYVAASVSYLLFVRRGQQSAIVDIAFFTLFHLLTLLFVLFVSGFLSAFLSVWIVLMISTELRFGWRGFLSSFASLALAGALMVVTYPHLPINEIIEVAQGILVVGAIGFVIAKIRGITDRERQALAKTREQEIYQRERLLALVNSMGDAVVATDDAGIIKVYNSTLLSLLDTNLNLTGKSIDDVLKLHNSAGHRVNIVDEAHRQRKIFSRTDLAHKFADSETIKLYINIAPIQPGYRSKAESGFIFILRDITKEKTLEEEKDEFVSVVSHELRTPVTIAEGNLSNINLLIDRGANTTVIKAAAHDAHEHILYLAKLVNDLGTLARAERGTGGDPEVVDIAQLMHDMYTTYHHQAADKKLHLNIDLPLKLPTPLTNRLYLQEILQNLITNALKYTQKGSVLLKAHRTQKGLDIAIQDTGIGIGKSDQKHIFEKFYRSEDYRTRESSGTGLGLYVCKKLAEKLSLELTFVSRLNHGTTFTLHIPNSQLTNPGVQKGQKP